MSAGVRLPARTHSRCTSTRGSLLDTRVFDDASEWKTRARLRVVLLRSSSTTARLGPRRVDQPRRMLIFFGPAQRSDAGRVRSDATRLDSRLYPQKSPTDVLRFVRIRLAAPPPSYSGFAHESTLPHESTPASRTRHSLETLVFTSAGPHIVRTNHLSLALPTNGTNTSNSHVPYSECLHVPYT